MSKEHDEVGSELQKEPGDTYMGDFGPDTTDPSYTNWVQKEREEAEEDK